MSIIVMTDDDFEENMQFLASQFNPVLAASFRARDTAQREALAEAYADKETAFRVLARQVEKSSVVLSERKIAQAQLAEAVQLLRKVDNDLWPEWDDTGAQTALLHEIQGFLARQSQAAEATGNSRVPAQAEQQEGLAPRIKCPACEGKRLARFSTHTTEEARCESCDGEGTVETAHGAQDGDEEWEQFVQFLLSETPAEHREHTRAAIDQDRKLEMFNEYRQGAWDAWKARAALATLPAVPFNTERARRIVDQFDAASAAPDIALMNYGGCAIEMLREAVRGAEHDQ